MMPLKRVLLVLIALWNSGCGSTTHEEPSRTEIASDAEAAIASAKREQPPFEEFAGTEACRDCHEEVFQSYLKTGHAQTLRHAYEVPFLQGLDGHQFVDELRGVTLHYHVSGERIEVSIPERFGDDRFELQYALGSGAHGITCLTLLPDVAGGTLGIEHRLTWYESDKKFRLTPGHRNLEAVQDSEMFGRIVHRDLVGRCVSCHATTSRIENEEIVDLIPHVGCESCHGPGRAHIRAVNEGKPDLAIKFVADSWTPEDEITVCAECHRSEHEIPDEVIRTDELRIVRFQSVGLTQSRCYTESAKAFSCATCHNPHHKPGDRSGTAYEAVCIDCHDGRTERETPEVRCRVSPEEGCIKCHMPPVEILPGVHFADHWIRIRERDDERLRALDQR